MSRFETLEESILETLEQSSNIQSSINLLPAPKCQAYIAIFEDALDQLAVLGDITPEVHSKGGDKPVSF